MNKKELAFTAVSVFVMWVIMILPQLMAIERKHQLNVEVIHGEIEYDSRLSDMEIGQSGYVTPWSFIPAQRILKNTTYYEQPHGTVSMKVKRTETGFEVWIPAGYRYY